MDSCSGLVILAVIVASIYAWGHSEGKREGSRKAYGVGYARGRRGRSGSDCFVATAVFVRPEHPALRLLRRYRDETLMRYRPGRAFVRTYYRIGPRLAAVVRRVPCLRRPIRRALLTWCWKHRRHIRGGDA